MTPPVGPTGLPEDCDGSSPPSWQVTGAVATMATTIVFDADVAIRETVVTATAGHFATPRLGWSVTAGGVVQGSVDHRDVRGGATLAGALTWLAVYERGRRPFVATSLSLGALVLRAVADDNTARTLSAWDVRGGAMVGKTFAGVIVPYAAVRVFGGPVFWRLAGKGVVGGDRYHVTAGLGLVLRLPARLSVSLEGMPLGERSAAGAIGWRF
jgi:hypothetical protein